MKNNAVTSAWQPILHLPKLKHPSVSREWWSSHCSPFYAGISEDGVQ